MRCAVLIAALLVDGGRCVDAARDEPGLKDVVRRMGAYVQAYGEKASIVVATEHYTQTVTGIGHINPLTRTTVADFAIVKAQGFGGWVGFRDVVEADGVALVDHRDRLLNVLSSVSGSLDEAQRLSDESARFNIGPVARNFNIPTAALFFFHPESLERFKFKRKRVEPDGTWEISFEETSHPTIVRTPAGRSLPAQGSVWVNPADGTILRTRMRMTDFAAQPSAFKGKSGLAQVEVSYSRVPALEMWLPETMTETYDTGRDGAGERTTAEARYSEYRRFQTLIRIK